MSNPESHPSGQGLIEQQQGSGSAPPCSPAPSYPPTLVFAVNMVAIYISIFCVALDNTIISTAIPKITDEFHALSDVGWYGSAYSLTQCAFLLKFGKLYRLFSPKWTFLASILLFEVGSLLCALAPTSLALILGRAIAGIGAAGIFAGALIIITHTSPLEKRPIWQSLISGMFGVASVLGPLVGGAFATHVTWRWCFYINLPLGGLAATGIALFLHLAPHKSPFKDKTYFQKFLMFDPVGLILFLPCMICLFVALEWGGSTYAWNDGRIIALFVVFGITLLAFVYLQWWLGEEATIPVRIASQRTIWSASWFAFFLSGAFFLFIYFIPTYFQAVRGGTALQSGIDILALILANVLAVLGSGFLVSRWGYVNPFCLASVVLVAAGSGLLMTLSPNTKAANWIGYQVLFGLGCGLGFQQPPIAAQTVLPFKDLPTGIAITLFARNLGTSLFITTGNNVLDSSLRRGLAARDIPGVDPQAVVAAGSTSFRSLVPPSSLESVIEVYNQALRQTFRVGLIISCIAALGAVLMEWNSVKKKEVFVSHESSEQRHGEDSEQTMLR